eukprot:7758771-Pyramimonas_sp.AAC.1
MPRVEPFTKTKCEGREKRLVKYRPKSAPESNETGGSVVGAGGGCLAFRTNLERLLRLDLGGNRG